ncbi:MAG: hypothetical protein HZA48_05600 [Planctomycetes bacterium]|nr:hypothetical protein [Planctomycetota bacterium]
MFKDHPKFKKPDDKNAIIWRYMDFVGFVSLLDKKSLYFSKADELQDPYEDKFANAVFGHRIGETKKFAKEPKKKAEQRPDAVNPADAVLTYVNCWHINHIESTSMWQVYLKSDEGVAIQSTYGKLKQSFSAYAKGDVCIGQVGYLDFAVDPVPKDYDEWPFLYKRSSFSYERELRAIVREEHVDLTKGPHELGKYISVNLDMLIEKIYVSPAAPIWFSELVDSITGKLGLAKKVIHSQLASSAHPAEKAGEEWFNKK